MNKIPVISVALLFLKIAHIIRQTWSNTDQLKGFYYVGTI